MARTPLTGRRVVAALLLVIAGFGCNPLLGPFKLLNINRARTHSEYNFYETARKIKDKKEIRIAVLTYRSRSLSPELISAERTLANMVVSTMQAGFEKNKERVTVLPVSDVDKFKQENDDWRAMDAADIAKKLNVDFIFNLELEALSIYEPGTRNLFRGHCRIAVTVIDEDKNAKKPELIVHPFTSEYPNGGLPIAADVDMTAEKFINQFMSKVAIELTGLFTALETGQRFRRL